jgi:hypothetical protein
MLLVLFFQKLFNVVVPSYNQKVTHWPNNLPTFSPDAFWQ